MSSAGVQLRAQGSRPQSCIESLGNDPNRLLLAAKTWKNGGRRCTEGQLPRRTYSPCHLRGDTTREDTPNDPVMTRARMRHFRCAASLWAPAGVSAHCSNECGPDGMRCAAARHEWQPAMLPLSTTHAGTGAARTKVNTGVANVHVGERHDLSLVRRIRQDLLWAQEIGVSRLRDAVTLGCWML